MAEQLTLNQRVRGSSPRASTPTKPLPERLRAFYPLVRSLPKMRFDSQVDSHRKKVQEYLEVLESDLTALLCDALTRDLFQRAGLLEKYEKNAILDKQRINAPETRKRVTAYRQLWADEAKASSDFALLGLTNHNGPLTKRDVRNDYRRMARKLHPDTGGSDEAFKQLHAAYRRVLAMTPRDKNPE